MTSERYNAREAEPRWQRQWDEQAIFASKNDDPRPKYYVLEMFPYPSGRIHIGHVRNYTLGDVLARYMRAKGFNVLHPMGWDAFGLPAENAAIERKVAPKAWTDDNIAAMKKQLRSIGLSLDWSREFATCDPSYYKHQQKMFLDFLRAGLAEREKRKVNWDPVDMTVLANEQVIDGRGWRSGAVVEQREMNQWVFKITKYAQDLLDALDGLDRWPDKVRLMQRNWIGRSEGLLIRFALDQATTPAGESAMNFAPNKVSCRVVKISSSSSPLGVVEASSAKETSRPSERPIQLRCMMRTFSGQPSSLSRPSSSSCAYAVIRKNHCTRSRCSTIVSSCRQQRPSITCSLASTVAHSGHQFTLLFLR